MSTSIPSDPDPMLSRRKAAERLKKAGYPSSEKSLATQATRGNGPPFYHFGKWVLYRESELLFWAEHRLTPLRRSTSEGDAQIKSVRSRRLDAQASA
jgi:hypothetical protein